MNAILATVASRAAVADDLRFAFAPFALGVALVAASDSGIAAILLGDDRSALARELANAFPGAMVTADPAGMADTAATVAAFLDAPHTGLDLPLDICGSALERAVWQALRAVPAGQTVTYGQVAATLPVAATVQEVGAACAANVLAVAIPCHRVVKADGATSGYRWGVPRKRRLINREVVA